MSGRSTIDHIFTLKQIIEKYYEFNRPLHLIFIDFKQAYDSVQRTEIWRSLKLLGVPSKLISMIRVSTEGSRCAVKFGHEKSEEFQTTTGLKQGDALSPILFNIVLEMAIREVQEEYLGINCGQNLPLLAYADDVVILGESEQDIKKATELLIRSANKRGLNINDTKTKYMRIGRNKDQRRNAAGIQVGEYMFEEVDDFKYLGTNLSSTNDNHEEIKKRMTSGNKCFYALSGLLGSKLLSKKSKERLYMVLARPVIMYACETWPTT